MVSEGFSKKSLKLKFDRKSKYVYNFDCSNDSIFIIHLFDDVGLVFILLPIHFAAQTCPLLLSLKQQSVFPQVLEP